MKTKIQLLVLVASISVGAVSLCASTGNSYIITSKPSETTDALASRHFLAEEELLKANPMVSSGTLRTGTKLVIPRLYRGAENGKVKVRSGDTLSIIALRFGANPQEIAKLNNIDPDDIQAGEWLKLPSKWLHPLIASRSGEKPKISNRIPRPESPQKSKSRTESKPWEYPKVPTPVQYIGVKFPEEVSLPDAAASLGVSKEELLEWNPELTAETPLAKNAIVRVPKSLLDTHTRTDFDAGLSLAPGPD